MNQYLKTGQPDTKALLFNPTLFLYPDQGQFELMIVANILQRERVNLRNKVLNKSVLDTYSPTTTAREWY